MKICHAIFSCDRVEYLKRALNSLTKLNYGEHHVDRLLIDDYPLTRDDKVFAEIAKDYNINRLVLNKTNFGIAKNIQNLFDILYTSNYDYILHQEDDVELLEPLDLSLLVDILETNKNLSQIQLKRNNWYTFETEEIKAKDDDIVYKGYRYEKYNKYFWTMFSIYPCWVCREPILEETKSYPNEFSIAKFLSEKYKLETALLKNKEGKNLIDHYGEYTQGKRVHETDFFYSKFSSYDPNKKYHSKTGKLYTEIIKQA